MLASSVHRAPRFGHRRFHTPRPSPRFPRASLFAALSLTTPFPVVLFLLLTVDHHTHFFSRRLPSTR